MAVRKILLAASLSAAATYDPHASARLGLGTLLALGGTTRSASTAVPSDAVAWLLPTMRVVGGRVTQGVGSDMWILSNDCRRVGGADRSFNLRQGDWQ